MDKFCVFCGERPISKTKEHVLPQWLLSITGDKKRTLKLSFPYSNKKAPDREIAFDAFHFPACSECNNTFSESEGAARSVVEKMLQHAPLAANEINILLSWLDKVRIGLWLGFLYLGENPFSIEPRFHVAKRVSRKDRALVLYRADDQRIGLHFQGTNVPLFHYLPCCFTLVINEFYLFNISADFLLARRIGFPYPTKSTFRDDGNLELQMAAGRERIMIPPIRLPYSRAGTEIYQPMFLNEVFLAQPELYDTDYVRHMSIDWTSGVGRPILAQRNTLVKAPAEPTQDWFPESHDRSTLHLMTIRETLNMQADLWDYLYPASDKNFSPAIKPWQRINRAWSKLPQGELSTLAAMPSK